MSVVIPAYNASKTIQACLESVFQQTRAADEVIVVDDGSSDDTIDIVGTYGSKVILISQENQGSAKARQAGSDAASYEYIAYLDSDDWWLDHHLQMVESAIQSNTIDFLFTDLTRADPNSKKTQHSEKNSNFYLWFRKIHLNAALPTSNLNNLYYFNQNQALNILLKGFPIYPSTMVVSKRALKKIGEWDIRFKRCQDLDFSLRIARKYGIFYFDDVHTVLGLHEVNSDVSSYVLMQTIGDVKVLKTHLSENRNNLEYSNSLRYALSSKLYGLGMLYKERQDCKNAIGTFIKSASFPGKRVKSLIQLLLSCFIIFKKPLSNLKE
jgi:glycosyltransferase involved in cell wall biosynthesis